MSIPTEPIGSIPRPPELLSAMAARDRGEIGGAELAAAQDQAVRDTIRRFEQTGSPVVTDGEQSRPSFATYPLAGLKELAPDGVIIPFADGHQRQLPVLTGGPFPDKALGIIAEHLPASARIFIGVTDPIDPRVETPGQVRDRILAAARQLPGDRLGTCDDCGFSPFADDTSTPRETAFAKIRARVEGTALASQALGL